MTPRVLLLLDNFEVVDEAAPLLSGCSGRTALALLVTTRTSLQLSGEYVYRVAPLPPVDAANLFAARARLVAPRFRRGGRKGRRGGPPRRAARLRRYWRCRCRASTGQVCFDVV